MKTIATAFPNRKYLFFSSISNVRLEARWNKGKVSFYSIEGNKEIKLSEEKIKHLFPTDVRINKRPFHFKDNKKFWIVLNRKKYRYDFEKLIPENSYSKGNSGNNKHSTNSRRRRIRTKF